MTIQLIDKKKLLFRIEKQEYRFIKPKYLMPGKEFRLIEAKVKGSTMSWNIEGGNVSYHQLKNKL
jgi:hypothetical protein